MRKVKLTMKTFVVLLAVIALARAKVAQRCTGVVIHGFNHEKETLKTGLDMPFQLAIDYDTDTLFFSYSTPEDEKDGFKSAYLKLKTNESGIISGITGGFANAVDPVSHTVYLGGNDGIYTYNYRNGRVVHAGARNTSIWQLFYKDQLYFTDYPNENAYTFGYGKLTKVPELSDTKVALLAVDKHVNFVFSNSSGLFIYRKAKSQIDSLGDYNLNGLTADINGNLYFSTPSSMYSIDENSETVTKLADIDSGIFGLAIESDNNIIYADSENILRLKPTKQKCT